jgi:hypothetical protein
MTSLRYSYFKSWAGVSPCKSSVEWTESNVAREGDEKGKQSVPQAQSDRPCTSFQNKKGLYAVHTSRVGGGFAKRETPTRKRLVTAQQKQGGVEATTPFAFVSPKERNTPMLQPHPTTDQPKKSRGLRPLLSGVLLIAVLAGALVFSNPARSGAHAASVATTHCTTKQSSESDGNVSAVTLIWISMKTSWCWNNSIVTSSHTVLSWGVTTWGNLGGWYTVGKPKYTFNCYVASGSTRNCSGNHEWMQEEFQTQPYSDTTCYLSLNQWENDKGQFFTNGSKHGPQC